MTETEHYKLKKPVGNEYVGPEAFNENADTLDGLLRGLETGKADLDPATGKVKEELLPEGVPVGDIDCGTFDDAGPLALHESSSGAHPLLVVDGNAAAASSGAETLEGHMTDPLAHQNIHLDGNMN